MNNFQITPVIIYILQFINTEQKKVDNKFIDFPLIDNEYLVNAMVHLLGKLADEKLIYMRYYHGVKPSVALTDTGKQILNNYTK